VRSSRARPVGLLDRAPTFLEPANASDEDKSKCHGVSLMPLLTGEGDYTREAAFAEEFKSKMVTTEKYKFVRNDEGENLLFDLEADPDELNNIIGTLPNVEAQMSQRIDEWLEATPPVREPNKTVNRKKKPKA